MPGGQLLPDGDYTATLNGAAIKDASGVRSLDGNGDGVGGDNYSVPLFKFAGDANRDRTVDFNDLVKLAQNYNTAGGMTWADGDFTGDGNVDFNDLVMLAQNYNTSFPAPGACRRPAPRRCRSPRRGRRRWPVRRPSRHPDAEAGPPVVTKPVVTKPVVTKPVVDEAGRDQARHQAGRQTCCGEDQHGRRGIPLASEMFSTARVSVMTRPCSPDLPAIGLPYIW